MYKPQLKITDLEQNRINEFLGLPFIDDNIIDWNIVHQIIDKVESIGFLVNRTDGKVEVVGGYDWNITHSSDDIVSGEELTTIEIYYRVLIDFIIWVHFKKWFNKDKDIFAISK
jgi:hypothetical protein